MALYLPAADLQLARGESYRDTALVLSRFLSAIMIRTYEQTEVDEFARHASVPVINGLTDWAHPLALADAMTIRERFGTLDGVRLAYLGDGNNVRHSLLRIAGRLGLEVAAATPGLRARPGRGRGGAPRRRGRRRLARARSRTRARQRGARTSSTRTSGRAWARRRSASGGCATSSRTASTIRCSAWPTRTRWRCTAYPRTS